MTTNMGMIDRALRFVIGSALLILALVTDITGGWTFWAALIIGAVFCGTALIGNCPLYTILGIRSCRRT